jgi:hypothetical protein
MDFDFNGGTDLNNPPAYDGVITIGDMPPRDGP